MIIRRTTRHHPSCSPFLLLLVIFIILTFHARLSSPFTFPPPSSSHHHASTLPRPRVDSGRAFGHTHILLLADKHGRDLSSGRDFGLTAKRAWEALHASLQPEAIALEEEDYDHHHDYDDYIPPNYIKWCHGNRKKAAKRWEATKRWREENGIDHILKEPHPHFLPIKKYCPNSIYGRGRQGEIVIYGMPGHLDVASLKAHGVGPEEMARHVAYTQEFMWNCLNASDDARTMTIWDVADMSIANMTHRDSIKMVHATGEVLKYHYPEKVLRILVVNAPVWVASAWALVAPLLPSSIREMVLVAKSLDDMVEYIEPSSIPPEYGGQGLPLSESPDDHLMLQVVSASTPGIVPPPDTTHQ